MCTRLLKIQRVCISPRTPVKHTKCNQYRGLRTHSLTLAQHWFHSIRLVWHVNLCIYMVFYSFFCGCICGVCVCLCVHRVCECVCVSIDFIPIILYNYIFFPSLVDRTSQTHTHFATHRTSNPVQIHTHAHVYAHTRT